MELDAPRIAPLAEEEWPEEVADMLRSARNLVGHDMNFFSTMARHPQLYRSWARFGNQVRLKSSLPSRDRELLILRIGWLCQAGYEFTHHITVARAVGIGDNEIERVKKGPDADGWDGFDAALLRAADELHANAFVTDATWKTLAERFSTQQLMDVVFCVGLYILVSMAVKSFGVQLEDWADTHEIPKSRRRQ